MLALPQTTGYAMLALSCLGHPGRPRLLARAIARATGVPLPYLSKLLHALHDSGLIHGKRGYRGGFVLARPPREISLYDVAAAVAGPDPLGPCLLGLRTCTRRRPCPTHDFWLRERARIERHLRRVSLADIAPFHARLVAVRRPPRRVSESPGHTALETSRGSRTGRGPP
jgi:Rrf2 family protein